jgi:hypothetical protein
MSGTAVLLPCELWQVLLINKLRHNQIPPARFLQQLTHSAFQYSNMLVALMVFKKLGDLKG